MLAFVYLGTHNMRNTIVKPLYYLLYSQFGDEFQLVGGPYLSIGEAYRSKGEVAEDFGCPEFDLEVVSVDTTFNRNC